MIHPRYLVRGNKFITHKGIETLSYVVHSWDCSYGDKYRCHFQELGWTVCPLRDVKPVPLTEEILLKIGAIENKEFPLLPIAQEWILPLKLKDQNEHSGNSYEISFSAATEYGIKQGATPGCHGDYTVNGRYASGQINYLHEVQSIYFMVTGEELEIKI